MILNPFPPFPFTSQRAYPRPTCLSCCVFTLPLFQASWSSPPVCLKRRVNSEEIVLLQLLHQKCEMVCPYWSDRMLIYLVLRPVLKQIFPLTSAPCKTLAFTCFYLFRYFFTTTFWALFFEQTTFKRIQSRALFCWHSWPITSYHFHYLYTQLPHHVHFTIGPFPLVRGSAHLSCTRLGLSRFPFLSSATSVWVGSPW